MLQIESFVEETCVTNRILCTGRCGLQTNKEHSCLRSVTKAKTFNMFIIYVAYKCIQTVGGISSCSFMDIDLNLKCIHTFGDISGCRFIDFHLNLKCIHTLCGICT